MEEKSSKCNSCNKLFNSEAVYVEKMSGEILCKNCLDDRIVDIKKYTREFVLDKMKSAFDMGVLSATEEFFNRNKWINEQLNN